MGSDAPVFVLPNIFERKLGTNHLPNLFVLRHTRPVESVCIRERLEPRRFAHGQRAILIGQKAAPQCGPHFVMTVPAKPSFRSRP